MKLKAWHWILIIVLGYFAIKQTGFLGAVSGETPSVQGEFRVAIPQPSWIPTTCVNNPVQVNVNNNSVISYSGSLSKIEFVNTINITRGCSGSSFISNMFSGVEIYCVKTDNSQVRIGLINLSSYYSTTVNYLTLQDTSVLSTCKAINLVTILNVNRLDGRGPADGKQHNVVNKLQYKFYTTASTCTPSVSCTYGAWSDAANSCGTRTKTCTDANGCSATTTTTESSTCGGTTPLTTAVTLAYYDYLVPGIKPTVTGTLVSKNNGAYSAATSTYNSGDSLNILVPDTLEYHSTYLTNQVVSGPAYTVPVPMLKRANANKNLGPAVNFQFYSSATNEAISDTKCQSDLGAGVSYNHRLTITGIDKASTGDLVCLYLAAGAKNIISDVQLTGNGVTTSSYTISQFFGAMGGSSGDAAYDYYKLFEIPEIRGAVMNTYNLNVQLKPGMKWGDSDTRSQLRTGYAGLLCFSKEYQIVGSSVQYSKLANTYSSENILGGGICYEGTTVPPPTECTNPTCTYSAWSDVTNSCGSRTRTCTYSNCPTTSIQLEYNPCTQADTEICCKSYGLGSGGVETNIAYNRMLESQCTIGNMVGGGRTVVADSYCTAPDCNALKTTLNSDIQKYLSGTITRAQLGESIMAWVNC